MKPAIGGGVLRRMPVKLSSTADQYGSPYCVFCSRGLPLASRATIFELVAINQFFSRDHANLHVPPHAYCVAACKLLWGLVEPIFTKLDSRVVLDFLSKATRESRMETQLGADPSVFVADRENLAAAAQ